MTRLRPVAPLLAPAAWAAALLALAALPAAAEPLAQPAWAFTVEPYGYLPWVNSTTTVRGFEVAADLGSSQLLSALRMAGSVRASAEHGRLGMLTDLAYTNLGAEKARPVARGLVQASGEVQAINGVYDLALRYRFGERESAIGQPGAWWLIPYAGARLVQASLNVDASFQGQGPLRRRLEISRTLERTWTQPLLGAQAAVFVSPGVRLFARGDLAGFGLAGERDISGNAQLGVGVAVGNNTELNLSWRYLAQAWSNGAERPTGYTSDQNGIELGLKFLF